MRRYFDFSKVPSMNWYPGHMSTTLKQMKEKLAQVDYVFEVRDARIPFSSINPNFEELLINKKHLIIYNKSDLADPKMNKRLSKVTSEFHSKNKNFFPPVILSLKRRSNIKYILDLILKRYEGQILPPNFKLMGFVIGVPNVGKSSLINLLRSIGLGHSSSHLAVKVGKLPGVTKNISGHVKILEQPAFYIMDTPGILCPHLKDNETTLKMALTGAIADTSISEILLSDFLLFILNENKNTKYAEYYGLQEVTDDIDVFLTQAASRIGAFKKGGESDSLIAARHFLKLFRQGSFGRFTLDKF